MPQIPPYIFGIHDPDGAALMTNAGKRGWVLVSVKVSPPDTSADFTALANAGHGVIVRLNYGYGSDGTIPPSNQYDTFANDCANFVASSHGANIWIIGNEMNHAGERPGNQGGDPNTGEVITPDRYGTCFAKCYTAIKARAGHQTDWVIPGAPAPWNPTTTYPANPNGDWVKYFQDILNACLARGAKPDALAVHTYTHGHRPELLASEDRVGGFPNYHIHFRAYRDFLAVVPAALKQVPVLITETQPADPDWWRDTNNGWVRNAFAEINTWNGNASNQPVQAVCLFRWNTGEANWSIADKGGVQDDFRQALANEYRVRMPGPPPLSDAALAAQTAAAALRWMPINTGASLYRFAQQAGLGYPQTDEFQMQFGGDAYVVQVYNGGIVYVKSGDWSNVKWVRKP